MFPLDKALKVLANATSYEIYAEMHREESEKKVKIHCQGIDPEPFPCEVLHPETPGEYCFPPLASLITGAARLMLALLEHSVCELSGTYAMEDTDSMAVVATEKGGLVPCKGGNEVTKEGKEAVRALPVGSTKTDLSGKPTNRDLCGIVLPSTPLNAAVALLCRER